MSAGRSPDLLPPRALPRAGGNGRRPALAFSAAAAPPPQLRELCEQFRDVCESAVDPLEIASALEFDGMADRAAQERYGFGDVFALAEEMYRLVQRRPAEPEPAPDPWRVSKLKPPLHGLLYGLPTVCFPAAAGLLAGPGVLTVLIVALLSSWALSQALAHLGYARLGTAGVAQARRVLRVGLAAGLAAVILLLAGVPPMAPPRPPVFVFGVGLAAYMLGATVLMVLGEERLLLAALAPGVLGSAAFLLAGRPAQVEHLAWAALAATPVLALGLAAVRTGGAGPAAGKLPAAAELRGALPSAGFGLLAAGLLVFPVAAGVHGRADVNTGALLASLPLALSMGAAEASLIWYRRRTQRLLHRTGKLRVFAARARMLLLAALLQYLFAAAVLTAAVAGVAAGARLVQPQWQALPQIAVYLALGGAMFLALLLQAFGSRGFPLAACASALAFEIGYRRLGVPGQLVACAGLLAVLAGYAAVVLGRAVSHAW